MNVGRWLANDPSVGPFRLRRYYSIASGIVIAVVVMLMSLAYHVSEVREHTELTGMRNEILARTFANVLWPEYGAFLMRPDISVEERRSHATTLALDARIREISREVPVIKIKVYNTAGVAVYSSVLDEIGENKSHNGGFIEAIRGVRVNELTHRGTMSGTEGVIENVDVVSSYIPIRQGADQKIVAVFELYSNVTELVAQIQRMTYSLLFVLVLIYLLLYFTLLLIVNHADRILKRQYLAIRDNEARLEANARDLEEEITERREVEAALRVSEEQAARASRAKSDFLSSMSHELRTPMNAILGFAQLLETEPGAPLSESQRRFTRQILKAGEHLLGLINQVLDLAKIEAGKMPLSLECVVLKNVFDDALPLVQSMAAQRDIVIKARDDATLNVRADYVRLKQVLLNLLSNAIKYNRDGGTVRLEARDLGGKVRIVVTDTGRGIAPEAMGELFQPFNRLGVQTAEVEGSGIGLALSKRLVESMGGAIGVDSMPERGSTFWVELPVCDGPEPLEAGREAQEIPNVDAAATGPRHTLLYIEDNPANLMLMEELVNRIPGVRLISAHTAELGIELAQQQRPDLIILDINLPGMNGFEALKRLRALPEMAAVPVMALTASAMTHDVERGLSAGFVRYLTKPIQVAEVTRSIRSLLEDGKA